MLLPPSKRRHLNGLGFVALIAGRLNAAQRPPADLSTAAPSGLCCAGPRLVDGLEFVVGLLHGREDLMPPGFPWEMWQQPEESPEAAAAAGAQEC